MRHGDKINNLGRTAAHRSAMLSNMANSLIEHKRITTTLAKAKALRRFVEPLLTKAKDNSTHSRRVVFGYLQSKEAIQELFSVVSEKIGDRPGGYVRIIKLGFRRGDGADMALIELVDFNEIYNPKGNKEAGKKKTRRSRRASSATPAAPKVAASAPVVEAAPAVVEEAVAEVEETVAPVVEETVADIAAEVSAPEAPATEEEKKEGEEA